MSEDSGAGRNCAADGRYGTPGGFPYGGPPGGPYGAYPNAGHPLPDVQGRPWAGSAAPRPRTWPGWVSLIGLFLLSVPVGGFALVAAMFGGDNCGTGTEGDNPICRSAGFAQVVFVPLLCLLIAGVLHLVVIVRAGKGRRSWVGLVLAWLVASGGVLAMVAPFL